MCACRIARRVRADARLCSDRFERKQCRHRGGELILRVNTYEPRLQRVCRGWQLAAGSGSGFTDSSVSPGKACAISPNSHATGSGTPRRSRPAVMSLSNAASGATDQKATQPAGRNRGTRVPQAGHFVEPPGAGAQRRRPLSTSRMMLSKLAPRSFAYDFDDITLHHGHPRIRQPIRRQTVTGFRIPRSPRPESPRPSTLASADSAASAAFRVNPKPSPPISTPAPAGTSRAWAQASSASLSSEPCWRVDINGTPSTRIRIAAVVLFERDRLAVGCQRPIDHGPLLLHGR